MKWQSTSAEEGTPVLLLILPKSSLSYSGIANCTFKKGKKAGVVLGGRTPNCFVMFAFEQHETCFFHRASLSDDTSLCSIPLGVHTGNHSFIIECSSKIGRCISVWSVTAFISRATSWFFTRWLIVILLKVWRRRHSSLFSQLSCLHRHCQSLWSSPGLTCLK